jgi:hypothetical protein
MVWQNHAVMNEQMSFFDAQLRLEMLTSISTVLN